MAYKLDTISFCTALKACIEMPRVKVAVFSSARYYNVVLEDIPSYIQQHYPDVTIFSVNNHQTMSFANGSMISAYPRTETSYRGVRCHFALYEERGISDDELMRIERIETPYVLHPDQWFSDIDVVPFDQHTSPHFQRVDYNPENFSVETDRDMVDVLRHAIDIMSSGSFGADDNESGNGREITTFAYTDEDGGMATLEFDSERFDEFFSEYQRKE